MVNFVPADKLTFVADKFETDGSPYKTMQLLSYQLLGYGVGETNKNRQVNSFLVIPIAMAGVR